MEDTVMKKLLLFPFILLMFSSSWAQSPNDPDVVIGKAIAELDASCANGEIREFVVKNQLSGTYTFEVTIKGKGQIASMNIIERGADGTIPFQNQLKDFVMFKYHLSFKMDKARYYKFNYTFSF